MRRNRLGLVAISAVMLPLAAMGEVICALGSGPSYNAYQDERPAPDAMELAGKVNRALAPNCQPRCPQTAVFRNATAANAMLVLTDGQAKIVYSPQFFTKIYDAYGDGAVVAVIAHLLGHALDETAPAPWTPRNWAPELRADAWAGCALAKIDLTVTGLREALTAVSQYPSPAHPAWSQRIPALRLGYTSCGGDGARFDSGARGSRPK